MKTNQLWFTNPGKVEICGQDLDDLKTDEVLVRSSYSAISAGTEMLAYRGQLPADMSLDSNLGAMQESTAYPLRYGYATTGVIEAVGADIDPSWTEKRVFAFQPHASHFTCQLNQLVILPDHIDSKAGLFLANMETAVNLVLDGNPRIGEQVLVIGQGVVGLLSSALLAQYPLSGLYALDTIAERRKWSEKLGVDFACDPLNETQLIELKQAINREPDAEGFDLVYELSGIPESLNQALELCGYSSRIIVGSWYGSKPASLKLGGVFHRNRIQIYSSQVSTIAPELTGRWGKSRRFSLAWDMIAKTRPQQLITHEFDFMNAAEAYRVLDQSPETAIQVILVHENPE